jgi:ribosomal protein S18 acetylase RimI-like enzyme
MGVVVLHDRGELTRALTRQPLLHLYAIGDLDDFFWPYTLWYGRRADDRDDEQPDEISDVALIYTGQEMPVLHALAPEPAAGMADLLRGLLPLLPRRFEAHLTRGLGEALASDYDLHSRGPHYKMSLTDRARVAAVDTLGVVPLGPSDLPEVERFYAESYPGNWFDPRMLATQCYFGWREDGRLLSVAGVHVYSKRYRVAALGNIATHPDARRRRLASVVTAKLCQALLPEADCIGLNVVANNIAAVTCYERLGFEPIAVYEEYTVEAR